MTKTRNKQLRVAYFLLSFLLPLSVTVSVELFSIEVPSEPIMIIIAFYISRHYLKEIRSLRTLLFHPITVVSLIWIVWMMMVVFLSSDYLVSIKYVIISILHWITFYAGFFLLASNLSVSKMRVVEAYSASLLIVFIYALFTFFRYDFNIGVSVIAARPFYYDHNILSACLCLLFGLLGSKLLSTSTYHLKGYSILLLLFILGLILLLSSRAAWVSMICASSITSAVWCYRYDRLRMFISAVLLITGLFVVSILLVRTEKNLQQFNPIYELKEDVSIMERLNRYKCAYRMFLERPVFGFGPGTFQFAFIPFQKSEEMTRISVSNSGPFNPGRGGSAHSEYFRALSEEGLPGLLFFLGLMVISCMTAIRLYMSLHPEKEGFLALGALFGISTFFVHGLFNNFLHQEELASLFWVSLATLSCLDSKDRTNN